MSFTCVLMFTNIYHQTVTSQKDNFFADIDEFNVFVIADSIAEYLDSSMLAYISNLIQC